MTRRTKRQKPRSPDRFEERREAVTPPSIRAAIVPSVSTAPSGPEWLPVGITVSVLVALWVIYRIALNDFVLGSVKGGWFHPYGHLIDARALATFSIVLPCACAFTWLTVRMLDTWEKACVLAWWVAAFPLQLVLRYPATRSFEAIIRSDSANSFYSPTLKYTAFAFLRDFSTLAPHLPEHVRTNMPGKVMLYFLLQQLTHSPQTMGHLLLAISNLGAVLVYCIVKELFGEKRPALFAAILYFFIPSKLNFLPLLNVISPVLILSCLLLHVRFLKSGRALYTFALGVGLYVTLMFDPLPLASGLLFGSLFLIPTLPTCETLGSAARTAGRSLLFASLGFAAVHAAVLAIVGFDVIGCFLHTLSIEQNFNVQVARPYSIWVWQNLIDSYVSVGAVVMPLAVAGAIDAVRSPARLRDAAAIFGLVTIATLLVLDVSGLDRGETNRQWIFLAVYFEINAALLLARAPGIVPFCVVLGVLLLQTAVTLDVVGFM